MNKLYFIFLFLLYSLTANAITINWNGTVNNLWNDAGNWTPNQIPTQNDDVVINPTTTSHVSIPSNYAAKAKSIKATGVTIFASPMTSLTLYGLAPGELCSMYLDNCTLVNHGNLWVKAIRVYNNSTIINFSAFAIEGDMDNTPTNMVLDNSYMINNSSGILYSLNNIESGAGYHKSAFLSLNDNAKIDNYGTISNQYNTALGDYLINGIIINNKSIFNNWGNLFLIEIHDAGIFIQNGALGAPFSVLKNYGSITITECSSCNTPKVGIDISQHGQFEDYVSSGSTVIITGFTTVAWSEKIRNGGLGTLVYFSVVNNPFNFQNSVLAVGSRLAGIGPINNLGSPINGILAPGQSPGIITFLADFMGSSSTVFEMELAGLAGAGAAAGHDQIVFEGATNVLDGTLDVVLIDGFEPEVEAEFVLISGPYTGVFSTVNLPGDASDWSVSYNANDVTIKLEELLTINNVGIGTSTPKSRLHIDKGDIYLESVNTGLILTDANGVCYKMIVDTNGVLTVTALSTCP